MMEITSDHYLALCENYKNTRHLMSPEDCETMRVKLNAMREHLAFKACVEAWKRGDTINIGDFIIILRKYGIEITDTENRWLQADLIEVGRNSYSSIGKIKKKNENRLHLLTIQLSNMISTEEKK